MTPLGLAHGTGFVGKATRVKLNQLYGCGSGSARVGWLEIRPANISLRVGETVQVQAVYQPPMPECAPGLACIQVMPAPQIVQADWTSSNTRVATVGYREIPCTPSAPQPNAGCFDFKNPIITGVSSGSTKLTASYKIAVGASEVLLSATADIAVTAGTTIAPRINSISPQSGPVGTKVTLTGSGFSTNLAYAMCVPPDCPPPVGTNTIRFGPATISNVRSDDEKTISFQVPSDFQPTCRNNRCEMIASLITPDTYEVSVLNANGASNSVSFTVTAASTETIVKKAGEREGSFLIQKINSDSVDGVWYEAYPVATYQGGPRTIRIGDDIGYACEGVSEKLISIDFPGQKVTFRKVAGNPPLGGCPICLSSNTLIDTPSGQVPVKNMKAGMPVWTMDKEGQRVAGIVTKTSKVAAPQNHQMVHLILDDGRELFASPGHPLIDGRSVGILAKGDKYDGALVASVKRVPYGNSATYDILPSGDTGFYWANGVVVGSTLRR